MPGGVTDEELRQLDAIAEKRVHAAYHAAPPVEDCGLHPVFAGILAAHARVPHVARTLNDVDEQARAARFE